MNTESTSSGPFGADPFQADLLVGRVMAVVRATKQDRPWRFIPRLGAGHLAAGMVAVIVVFGAFTGLAWSRPSSAGSTPSPHGTFHEAGLSFDYPSTWTRSSASGLGLMGLTDVMFIGSGTGTAACTPAVPPSDGGSQLCTTFVASLEPGTIVARIEIHQMTNDPFPVSQRWDISAGGTRRVVIGGLPAFTGPSMLSHSALGADRVTTWVLSSLQDLNRHYQITVAMRGPDLPGLQAQVDALFASVTFDAPANTNP